MTIMARASCEKCGYEGPNREILGDAVLDRDLHRLECPERLETDSEQTTYEDWQSSEETSSGPSETHITLEGRQLFTTDMGQPGEVLGQDNPNPNPYQ
jgi:hypothetical protein